MNRRFFLVFSFAAALLFLLFAIPVNAQDTKSKTESPRNRVNRQFAATSPAIGSLLPDITIHDRRGKALPLRSLKGSHAVIVFGCLT